MNYPYGLLPDSWLWTATIIYLMVLIPVLIHLPWKQMAEPGKLHVFLGTCVGLMVLWNMSATFLPGLDYHFLGTTLLTLMFGWRQAFLAINLILLSMILGGHADWQTHSINALIMGLLPIAIAQSIFNFADRKMVNNFFIYVLFNGFFGAALTMCLLLLSSSCLLLLGDIYTLELLNYKFYPYLPLLMFPEAFITGMLITIMVAMTPGWVSTFDDHRYIHGK
ncbi:MAG: energy-coupling factor ABC transporter permease [Gammaproteobacteria bacterium]|nr:energy-coupling factor ABC transporter permease [Gammaproteobacteria bacterium]